MSASTKNSTTTPLLANNTFAGSAEDVGAYGSYTIAFRCSTSTQFKILQGAAINQWDDVRILAEPSSLPPAINTDSSPLIITGLLKMKYFKLEIFNNSGVNQTYLRADVVFRDAMPLNFLDNSISVGGVDYETGTRHLLSTNAGGVLNTTLTGSLPTGENIIGGAVCLGSPVSNPLSYTPIALSDVGNKVLTLEENSADIKSAVESIDGKITACDTGAVVVSSGDITETNSGSIKTAVESIDTKITACNTGAVVVSSGDITETNSGAVKTAVESIDGKITACNTGAIEGSVSVLGQEPQHVFYASADTNIPAVYADGVQGSNVSGGWSYTNSGFINSKINWYLYGNTAEQGATAKKIKDIDFMYAVIDQKTTLGLAQGQNPFFIFYSLPDSATNASWFKSKFFYGSNAHTDVLGIKLLFIGTDNPLVHPEITGINRIRLDFVLAQSTKTIEQGAEELLWLGSLQTTGNPAQTAGAFNFVFSEYGIDFAQEALNQIILPIVADKVMANVTGSAVEISTALPTGTNRIGEVITREDPASASNLTGLNDTSQQIKASAGSLMNLSAFNSGNATSYIKIYNSLTATNADTPIITLPIRHDSALSTINTHNLQFSTGICVRATAGYDANDNTAPNGTTSLVAFYNGVF